MKRRRKSKRMASLASLSFPDGKNATPGIINASEREAAGNERIS